jgi:hypothetical protein
MNGLQGVMVVFVLIVLASCSQLEGKYVPLDRNVKNPYYQDIETKRYDRLTGDSVQYYFRAPYNSSIRPFYDTIEFVGSKEVRALHRANSMSSCCAPAVYLEDEQFTRSGDTLKAKYGTYLVKGDSLFPLHYGSIYVKE